MTEDLYPLVLAYLLNEMDPLERSDFEIRLAREPALAALLQSMADGLAADVLAQNPSVPLPLGRRNELTAALLAAVQGLPAATAPRFRFQPYLWPAAAVLLLALNLAQWLHHARPSALTVDLVEGDRTAQGQRSALVYSEPAPLRQPGVVPVLATNAHPAAGNAAPSAASAQGSSTVAFSSTITVGTTAAAQHPYAWSAFDGTQHQGVLDLHNLPAVPADRALEFWVLTAGAKTFERVGEIPPQYYGRSGKVTYKLPSANVSPVQILITVERRGSIPAAPSSSVVLHGP